MITRNVMLDAWERSAGVQYCTKETCFTVFFHESLWYQVPGAPDGERQHPTVRPHLKSTCPYGRGEPWPKLSELVVASFAVPLRSETERAADAAEFESWKRENLIFRAPDDTESTQRRGTYTPGHTA